MVIIRLNSQPIQLSIKRIQNILVNRYHDLVIEHYEKPRNVGSLPKNDPQVGTGVCIHLNLMIFILFS